MASTHVFSKEEEISNSITHGIGVILSIAALVILIVFASLYGNVWHVVSFTLFGVTMLLLYTSSTLLHALKPGEQKIFLRLWIIHPFISLLQVRTLPFYWLPCRVQRVGPYLALFGDSPLRGTIFKSFFVKKFLFTSTLLYVVMGWLIVFVWNDLVANIHPTSLILLIIGGLLYTVGAIFYIWKLFKHHHAVWHVFVLSATVCHFFAVLYLLP